MKPNNIILEGITGSKAYGLDTATSDTDIKGVYLLSTKEVLLSTKAVDKAYRGYAMGQAERLARRTAQGMDGYDSSLKNRFAKHTRHCFRLLLQCRQLLETGELTVRVTPEQREWLFSLGEAVDASSIVAKFMEEDAKMNDIKSVLPDKPDVVALDELLFKIRQKSTPVMQFIKARVSK